MSARRMDAAHFREIAAIEEWYWWHQARFRLAASLLGDVAARRLIVDFGCGPGGFLHFSRQRFGLPAERLLAVEPSPHAHPVIRARGLPLVIPEAGRPLAELLPRPADGIVALDVIEHLDDPVAALADLRAAAAEDARLVVTVPALAHLWSSWDDKLGHRRRYDKKLLRAQLAEAGWDVRALRYGFFGMYLPVLLRRIFGRADPEAPAVFPRVPRAVNALLLAWSSVENRFPAWPFGTSLIAAARPRRAAGRH